MKPDPKLSEFLYGSGLAVQSDHVRWTKLMGGVSSDIWRIEVGDQTLCVKRALPRLKVNREWVVSTSRNSYEWRWIEFVVGHLPDAVPRPLAHDPDLGVLAMEYLDPDRYPVWKSQLLAGRASPDAARAVATLLGQIHEISARDRAVPGKFASDDIFYAIRIEPYLIFTAQVHTDLGPSLRKIADAVSGWHRVLVHGDVSPKNILIGATSPVFLDAECAWYGDAAFDLAFCLNHLLLLCLPRPREATALFACFEAFANAYLSRVDWEPVEALERRAAALLPALLLARVDGKSPVEYLTASAEKDLVRNVARSLVSKPPSRLEDVAVAWHRALRAFQDHIGA